jgi:hypothetical protein
MLFLNDNPELKAKHDALLGSVVEDAVEETE